MLAPHSHMMHMNTQKMEKYSSTQEMGASEEQIVNSFVASTQTLAVRLWSRAPVGVFVVLEMVIFVSFWEIIQMVR